MKLYAKIVNDETKLCEIGTGTNTSFYQSIGMELMDVEQSYDGSWYVAGYAPEKPAPTHDEISKMREEAYIKDVDPITCHINRLKDEERTPEIEAEIAGLIVERTAKVVEIKERYPYPEETEIVEV